MSMKDNSRAVCAATALAVIGFLPIACRGGGMGNEHQTTDRSLRDMVSCRAEYDQELLILRVFVENKSNGIIAVKRAWIETQPTIAGSAKAIGTWGIGGEFSDSPALLFYGNEASRRIRIVPGRVETYRGLWLAPAASLAADIPYDPKDVSQNRKEVHVTVKFSLALVRLPGGPGEADGWFDVTSPPLLLQPSK